MDDLEKQAREMLAAELGYSQASETEVSKAALRAIVAALTKARTPAELNPDALEERVAGAIGLWIITQKHVTFGEDDYRDIARAAIAKARTPDAALSWVGEVYPDATPSGGALVEMTWEQFNALRRLAGLKPVAMRNPPAEPAAPEGEWANWSPLEDRDAFGDNNQAKGTDERVRELAAKATPLLECDGKASLPHRDRTRVVGFILPEDVVGLSDGLFMLDALVELAKLNSAALSTLVPRKEQSQ